MTPRWMVFCLLFLFLPCALLSRADDQKSSAAPSHLTKKTQLELISALNAEIVYISTVFPMGKKGLTIHDGVISPNGQDLQQLLALWGPSVKPGDIARITAVVIKGDRIHFEINGGPVKKKKWYQHIQISGVGGGEVTPGSNPDDAR